MTLPTAKVFFQRVIVYAVMLPETLTNSCGSVSVTLIATKLHILLAREASLLPFLPPKVTCDAVLIVPQFYAGTVALITINSGAQIHPLIATRWCSSLKGKNLRYVMVANHGYLPDRVNFAARIAKNRANPDIPVDLIASFKAAAETDTGGTCKLVSASQ